jgi:hypothetical protein
MHQPRQPQPLTQFRCDRIVRRIPVASRPQVVGVLQAFADAAGEVPEQEWSLGWRVSHD